MKPPNSDLDRYTQDLHVILSHIEAARSRSIGLYMCNPDTHGVPSLDEIDGELEVMASRVEHAIERGYAAKNTR